MSATRFCLRKTPHQLCGVGSSQTLVGSESLHSAGRPQTGKMERKVGYYFRKISFGLEAVWSHLN